MAKVNGMKRIQLERKAAAEKEKLSKIHIISSVDELNQVLMTQMKVVRKKEDI